MTLSGIICIHSITDQGVGITRRNFSVLRKLSGMTSLEKVVVVTSRWYEVSFEDGTSLELRLMSSDLHFKPACDKGATFERWDGTKQCTHDIIRLLMNTCSHLLSSQMTLVKSLAALSELTPIHENQSAESNDSQRTFCSEETQGYDEDTEGIEKQRCHEAQAPELWKVYAAEPGHSTQIPNSQNDTLLPDYDTLLQILDDGASGCCPVGLRMAFIPFYSILLNLFLGLLHILLRCSPAVSDGLRRHIGP